MLQAVGCGADAPTAPPPAGAAAGPLDSSDILARPATADTVDLDFIVIAWKDLPNLPPGSAAATRTKADADRLATEVVAQARRGADFASLAASYSDDPTKGKNHSLEIDAKTPVVEEFKNLALRLQVGEVGVTSTKFGWIVVKRAAPSPPDPLESADILARAPVTEKAKVKHILLGWTDAHATDPRGTARTRADLEQLVKDTVAKLRAGAKIEPLMAKLSEDPGSAKSGTSYDVTPDAALIEPFKRLSLRLRVGEVGVVKTQFGIHIVQRVE